MLLSTAGTSVNNYTGQGVQPVVQAQLAANLTNSNLVLGNANAVPDTLGTGNWKFYVAGNTSAEAITSESASTEWTGGSLLSYTDIDYYMFYPFNTNAVSGNTLLNIATNTYDATLYGNASIINTVPSPATKPTSTGTGYLSMNIGAGQYVEMNQPVSLSLLGITFAFWFRWSSNVSNTPVFSFDDGTNYFIIHMWTQDWCNIEWKTPSGTAGGYFFNRGNEGLTVGEWVHIAFKSSNGSIFINGTNKGSFSYSTFVTMFQPTKFYLGNTSANASFLMNGRDFVTKVGTISVDNFIFYNKTLTDTEIGTLYAQSTIYYTFDSDSISGGTSVGSKATGIYVYNATLVNGASIGTTNPSPAPTSGTGHLLLTSTNTVATNPHVRLTIQPPFNYTHYWFSVAFWARSNSTLGSSAKITFFDFANSIAASENANYSYSMYLQSNAVRAKISYAASGAATSDALIYTDPNILTDNVWRHYVWTIDSDGKWYFYINSVLVFTKTGGGKPAINGVPAYDNCYIGRDAGSWQTASFSGAIDEFRWYKSRTLSQGEVSNLYSSQAYIGQLGKFQNPSGGSPIWMSKPATTILNTFETSYTVKSTEIALTPGENSTYAVWTAAKTTNIRIDVSFADYHSRSTGVGFQMFKINADDTFGSTIFPRTVTGNALTNAASSNYLSVPSRTLSVSPGDKIFYRIDANGNTVTASSVLATNIYTDSNYVPVPNSTNINETQILQARLATNLNSATLVSGNANTIYDTVGTGDWKFYVAGNTSVAAISSASNATEWTGGSILPYVVSPVLPTDMSFCFNFNSNTVSGTTVSSSVGGYTGTLVNGATIGTDGSPAPGGGYLSLTKASGHYFNFPPTSVTAAGFTISMWFRATSNNVTFARLFDMWSSSNFSMFINTSPEGIGLQNGANNRYIYTGTVIDNAWRHITLTIDYAGASGASSVYKCYINGTLQTTTTAAYPVLGFRTSYNLGTAFNFGNGGAESFDGGLDDFRLYHRAINATEVSLIYSQASIYYPFELADISLSTPTKVGDLATGSYVYNGTLTAGSAPSSNATITVDSESRVSGKGYLSLVKTNKSFFNFTPFNVIATGLSFSLWFRATTSNESARLFDMRTAQEISLSVTPTGLTTTITGTSNGTINPVAYTFNVRDNVWRHVALTVTYAGASGVSSIYRLYVDGILRSTSPTRGYPPLGVRTYYCLGTAVNGNSNAELFDGGIDDFRVYQIPLSQAEVTSLYTGPLPPALKDTVTGANWTSKPAILLDDIETSYTVKSNEIALKPGTNSTYAIWTAPKTTNIRVDVSFADYHSRSNGVGFQMFKINADNTFGSTIFPRTVTSAVLKDVSANYLSVPSRSLSVVAGDKLVYRIDGNGNPTSSSSVLATNIYADPNYVSVPGSTNVNETKVTQAQLATNLNSTTFVSGNANIVYDTVGTGNWNFYVAGNASVASISSTSNSSEWTVASPLSYSLPLRTHYQFDSNRLSGNTIVDSVSGNSNATLANGAKTSTTAAQIKYGTGSLDLSTQSGTGVNCQHLKLPTFTVSQITGFSVSLWFYQLANTTMFMFDFASAANASSNNMMLVSQASPDRFDFYPTQSTGFQIITPKLLNQWVHLCITIRSDNFTTVYQNATSIFSGTPSGNSFAGPAKTHGLLGAAYVNFPGATGYIDDFRIYNRDITQTEVTAIYNGNANTFPSLLSGSITNTVTTATWMPIPATPLDASETSYTVKSNEIALKPGINSTYAIWTAPKTTNLKIDVSFADYHTRSAGVGFQMFKINADNTFGSTIFPPTVTSAVLTDSSVNYLTVPSVNISVVTGDKVVYRVDANGNTTAASSVLATNIYSYSGIWN